MTGYNVSLEYPIRVDHLADLEDTVDRLMDLLAPYHGTISGSPRGRLSVRLTFTADDVEQASRTAVLAVGAALRDAGFSAANREAVILEAMTEAEFDTREGFEHIPDMVSATEAAEILAVSRVRVNQMIDDKKFSTAQRIGNAWAIGRREVEAKAAKRAE
jgi:hypothetical protein